MVLFRFRVLFVTHMVSGLWAGLAFYTSFVSILFISEHASRTFIYNEKIILGSEKPDSGGAGICKIEVVCLSAWIVGGAEGTTPSRTMPQAVTGSDGPKVEGASLSLPRWLHCLSWSDAGRHSAPSEKV